MIRVEVERGEHHQIAAITLTGHADYDEPGKDIVCAAVSGVSFGLINSVEILLDVELEVQMDQDKGGFLRCRVPGGLDLSLHEKVQLLMEAMAASLRSIADEYGKYVKVDDKNNKEVRRHD